jgi:hypothetical protein
VIETRALHKHDTRHAPFREEEGNEDSDIVDVAIGQGIAHAISAPYQSVNALGKPHDEGNPSKAHGGNFVFGAAFALGRVVIF